LITRYIAVADAVAERLARTEAIPRQLITTVYNGVELPPLRDDGELRALRAEFGIPDDAFVVGSVAHMRAEKGYDVFFQAIEKLKARVPGIKAVIVGRVFPQYPPMVEKMGISDNVLFVGHTDRVRDYTSIMDVACLTAVRNEGLSNAILEEMALAKPVVATTVGGSPELVVQDRTGFLVPPGNADALIDAIWTLHEDRELLARMGAAARSRVESDFTVPTMMDNMERLYLDVLEREAS
jgi:glycosyltransferase involved in cell wall biosynthesis